MGKKHWHHARPPSEAEDAWWQHRDSKKPQNPGRPDWPPMDHWQDWEHGPPMPPWWKHRRARHEWRHSDRFLFVRFAVAFGLFVLLGCGVLFAVGAGAMFLLRHRPTGASAPPGLILPLIAAVILLVVAFRVVGGLAARRLTQPLSETMKAADAIAGGDLSARVALEGSGEFSHFARSFNRMAEALESADRQRRELLADVAHELRTPLTVIQGNLEGLRDGVYQATPEHLDLILDETHNLSRLVDDLRLLTLAEAGQLPLDPQPLDVPQLLADVRDAFSCQADEAEISLAINAPKPLPPLVADPQRLGQIMSNLIANALRHTPRGGEVILGAAPAPGAVRLWVADTGEGIQPEDLPRIFDRFWRADPARSHESGVGMGLGLAIAKSLVEAHGGRIWAESQVGQGTTVSCILPAPTA